MHKIWPIINRFPGDVPLRNSWCHFRINEKIKASAMSLKKFRDRKFALWLCPRISGTVYAVCYIPQKIRKLALWQLSPNFSYVLSNQWRPDTVFRPGQQCRRRIYPHHLRIAFNTWNTNWTGTRELWRQRSHGWPNFVPYGAIIDLCSPKFWDQFCLIKLINLRLFSSAYAHCRPTIWSLPPGQLGQSTSNKNVGNNVVLLLHIFIFHTI